MDEDVLILRLDHVVSLGSKAGHVAVYIDSFFVLHPLEHGVNHNEGTRPPDPGTVRVFDYALVD